MLQHTRRRHDRKASNSHRRRRIRFEQLEQRLVLSTFSVINTDDSGPDSLRQAILDANATPGTDTIDFNIPGAGPHTIQPLSALPTVTNPAILDASSQPGYAGTPLIELDGSLAGLAVNGLHITAGNSTVRGFAINRFQIGTSSPFHGHGIWLETGGGNVVQSNFIGTDTSGTIDLGNGHFGVFVDNSSDNLIGTNGDGNADAAERNLISGNSESGLYLWYGSSRNTVAGNFIGTDVTGTVALGNDKSGVGFLPGTTDNIIGTDGSNDAFNANERNIISSNGGAEVGAYGDNAVVAGNFIGTDVTGTVSFGPDPGLGGVIVGGDFVVIGTNGDGIADAEERNVISGHSVGVYVSNSESNVIAGNLIGTDATGTTAIPNTVGVLLDFETHYNLIGTNGDGVSDVLERNIISGNIEQGIRFQRGDAHDNVIAGNFIGTDVTGTTALGNGRDGILTGYLGSPHDNLFGTDADGVADEIERNVISANGQSGIELGNATQNVIAGNYLGTDVTGTVALSNGSSGLYLPSSVANLIGTNGDGVNDAAERNLISGDGGGIYLRFASDNIVAGNLIGTDVTGTQPLGLSLGASGVAIYSGPGSPATGNLIGTDSDGLADDAEANVIAGLGAMGIDLYGDEVSGNVIAGNFIGTNATGTLNLGNGSLWPYKSAGVVINGGAHGNTVGGVAPNAGNVIAFNDGNGVHVVNGSTENAILGNSIYDNDERGIDLDLANTTPGDGVTPNDPGDGDTGPNNLQNFPVITAVSTGTTDTTIVGTLNSTPSTSFTLQFFSNPSADPSGHGEGEVFLGSSTVVTDVGGNASFNVQVPVVVDVNHVVTATATDPAGNTSEFSAAALQCSFTVTHTGDSGFGSLRRAITCANVTPGTDTVGFNIPGAGPHTIQPLSALPTVTDPVILDATTQPGYAGTPLIELDGSLAGLAVNGLHITAGNSTVRGFAINRFQIGTSAPFNGHGIWLETGDGNVVQANFIGTNTSGTIAMGNEHDGLRIRSSSNNLIGTDGDGVADAAEGNIISANFQNGLYIRSSGSANRIAGNLIGTDVTGTVALGNLGNGITVGAGTSSNIVGTNGSNDAFNVNERNIVAGNRLNEISVESENNVVAGNFIGMDVNGTIPLGDVGSWSGVFTNGTSTVIGTNGDEVADAVEGNLIAGRFSGIWLHGAEQTVIAGNKIGTDITGTVAMGGREGILLAATTNFNLIGTNGDGVSDALERNVISGHDQYGIHFINGTSHDNVVAGNFIGTDVTGTAPLGNGREGIRVSGHPSFGIPHDNLIGTDADGVADATERNVIAANGASGIQMGGSTNNVIAGNYIGTDVTGSVALPNTGSGIFLPNSTGNLIGTNGDGVNDEAERNVISSSTGDGIFLRFSSDNVVAGNLIGTDATGTLGLAGNGGSGVLIVSGTSGNPAVGNRIGTNSDGVADASEANVISAWGRTGVALSGAMVTSNVIAGNFIGTDSTRTLNLGNGTSSQRDGILITDGAHGNTVGGVAPQAANVIAFNDGNGVRVAGGSTENAVLGNSIYDNDERGIDLDLANVTPGDGVTLNDPGDGDAGPNNLQNFPVITSTNSTAGNTTVDGNLNSTPNTAFRLELYSSPTADPSGHGEGQTLLGFANVTTDTGGNVSFSESFPVSVLPGHVVSATATDPASNTSEFSAAFATPLNQPPEIDPQSFNIDENLTAVGTVDADDPDLPGDTLTFSITGNGPDDAKFAITAGGALTFIAAPDFETPTDVGGTAGDNVYLVEVEVEDSHDETATALMTVTVDPVNDNAPAFTSPAAESVVENSTTVQSISAADDDLPDQTITFSITGNGADDGFFQLTGGNQLAFITAPDFETPLDANTDNIYEVEIEADDNNGLTTTQTLLVSVLNQASISGVVFVDVNENSLYDANEPGIDGVLIELLDELGAPVLDDLGDPITATTSGGGFYLFEDLEPAAYQVFENHPSGVDDGPELLGSLGGTVVANETMELTLNRTDAADYVFAELGQEVTSGDTATIGFWQNKHGQALITQGGTALATWLTSNFGNVFGNTFSDGSGDDDGNEVASFFKNELFKQKGKKSAAGPAKVDAQFMGVALATYFTSSNLAGNVAASYGFNVTTTGIGTKVVNVGSHGSAFGVADDTDLTIMQLLLATNALTDHPNNLTGAARLYDTNGDGVIDAMEAALRTMANEIYSSINEEGDI